MPTQAPGKQDERYNDLLDGFGEGDDKKPLKQVKYKSRFDMMFSDNESMDNDEDDKSEESKNEFEVSGPINEKKTINFLKA